MERYFKRKSPESAQPATNDFSRENINVPQSSSIPSMPKLIDLNQLPSDPHDRKRILDCHPNQRDEIRRAYVLRGPCRPEGYIYPTKMIGEKPRRFNPKWFESFDWLEYSVKLDKVFCLPCYLFNDQVRTQVGSDAFVSEGFGGWNKMQERLEAHIGKVGSVHNKAIKNCDALMRRHQSIVVALHKQSDITKNEYRIRLNASIDVSRYLLNGLFPFNEIGDHVFAFLVDESSDVSKKEQMDVVSRYVDDTCGLDKERFVGLVHVKETSALTLKSGIDSLLTEFGLSLQRIRGQGYDDASNMRGEYNV
ncbi:TTF-type domain-containing protein [Heracleum sosnowskyi]|uniref:TTF-type domain-containing protein n=1 Tax=Heracleum sosnowskyi TaxID=360622 RepID=A0AAD8IBT7_9APIA|nr:TTF-type domain-containing protein [Heracleum sosnowskyi]